MSNRSGGSRYVTGHSGEVSQDGDDGILVVTDEIKRFADKRWEVISKDLEDIAAIRSGCNPDAVFEPLANLFCTRKKVVGHSVRVPEGRNAG